MTARKRNSLETIQRNADELVNSLTFRIATARIDDVPAIQVELRKARQFRDLVAHVRRSTVNEDIPVNVDGASWVTVVRFDATTEAGSQVFGYGTRNPHSVSWSYPLASEWVCRTWQTLDGARRHFLRRLAEFNGLLDVVEG